MPNKIEQKYVLLVEGNDEVYFFQAFLKHIGIADVQVIEIGGKDKFKSELPAFIVDPGFSEVKAFAVIRDADNDMDSAINSVSGVLERNDQPSPKKHAMFAADKRRKSGIFIIPGNADEGMLEGLCLKTVENHPVLECVSFYIECLEKKLEPYDPGEKKESGKIYFPKNLAKAKAHSFLAGMHDFKSSVGIAAKKGYWNLDSPHLNDLKSFLEILISEQ